jgi:5'-methylthioadenosine phosphorylase
MSEELRDFSHYERSFSILYDMTTDASAHVAVIGGSGFYELEGLTDVQKHRARTPFGDPSDAIMLGTLAGVRMAFLPRHGVGHRILPAELPARANIWALKQLGVERIISVSAVGSLRRDIAPLHLVVPDQFIDRTRGRRSTFFGRGLVAHIAFDQPVCPEMSALLATSAESVGADVHKGGTGIVIDGPAFSTKKESMLYQSWGADVIGMTALPEAKLAREAEMCYSALSLVTDYDTWHESNQPVTAEMVLGNLTRNVETAKNVVSEAVSTLPQERECSCGSALSNALVTAPELVPDDVKRDLAPIIERYMPVGAGV